MELGRDARDRGARRATGLLVHPPNVGARLGLGRATTLLEATKPACAASAAAGITDRLRGLDQDVGDDAAEKSHQEHDDNDELGQLRTALVVGARSHPLHKVRATRPHVVPLLCISCGSQWQPRKAQCRDETQS